jgi:hypothetical protein
MKPAGALAATKREVPPVDSGSGRGEVGSAAAPDGQRPTAATPASGASTPASRVTPPSAPASASAAADPGVSLPELPNVVPHTLRVLAQEGVREARIRLRPPELGSIHVLVQVEGNRVAAHIAAERAPVRALLEHLREELGQSLKDAGLRLVELKIETLVPGAEKTAENTISRPAASISDPATGGPISGSPAGGHFSASSSGARQQGHPADERALPPEHSAAAGANPPAPVGTAPRPASRVDAWA